MMAILTEEDYWKHHYERLFLELAYRVMKKAGIQSIIIDDGALAGAKDSKMIHVTESANKQTILLELKDATPEPYFYHEDGSFTKEAWDNLTP